jgi:hypothetical protein
MEIKFSKSKNFPKNDKKFSKTIKKYLNLALLLIQSLCGWDHACLEDFGKAISLVAHWLPFSLLASLRH